MPAETAVLARSEAALKLMRRLLKRRSFTPALVTTEQLPSYGAAFAEFALAARHDRGRRRNSRGEVSHRSVRRRERNMQ